MSKGFTAAHVRKLLREHKQPLKQRIAELEATIKAIRELEPIFADTAVNITERVYRADELEALLPKEQP